MALVLFRGLVHECCNMTVTFEFEFKNDVFESKQELKITGQSADEHETTISYLLASKDQ